MTTPTKKNTTTAKSGGAPPQPRVYDAPLLDSDEAAATSLFAAVESQYHKKQPRSVHPLTDLNISEREAKKEAAAPTSIPSLMAKKKPLWKKAINKVIEDRRTQREDAQDHIKMKTHRSKPSMSLDLLGAAFHQRDHSASKAGGATTADTQRLSDDPYNQLLNEYNPNKDAFMESDDDEESEEQRASDDQDDDQQQLPMTEATTTTEYGTLVQPLVAVDNRGHKGKSRFSFKSCWKRPCAFLKQVVRHCIWMVIALPLTLAALILFYFCGNPSPDFLPYKITFSWWCNFAARQIVTFELARLLQFLLVDCFLLSNRILKRIMGPFVVLFLLQSKGWPFILVFWSILDLFLLHGSDTFNNHWLYWTGYRIYSAEANSGAYMLDSEEYLRFLLSLMFVGTAVTLKRVWLAIAFGRRLFAAFKPKLESILVNMVLLSEAAALATYADTIVADTDPIDAGSDFGGDRSAASSQDRHINIKEITKKSGGLVGADGGDIVKWSTIDNNEDEEEEEHVVEQEGEESSGGNAKGPEEQETTSKRAMDKLRFFSRSSSGSLRIKQLLDPWEEPKTKDSEDEKVSMEDILRFRQALDIMDEYYPFGEDFGRASTREECIESAHHMYYKLLKLSTSKDKLSFSVFELLLEDEFDDVKLKSLRRLFRPGVGEALDLLMFVQSVDSLYRRLRYFRASVSNAGSLDQTLEGIFNVFFYFVLGLSTLVFMNFNPWSMLVSCTSLLVSFSFAFGSTVSKYVQGILLIAVSRPFDLGDRIFIAPTLNVQDKMENAGIGWFVEDITLSMTKLRYAKTNEVAYLANHLISEMRIYNCNRSPSATVMLDLVFGLEILKNDNLEKFRQALRIYVKENPRTWHIFNFLRVEAIDANNGKVSVMLSIRHRNSWQEAPRIRNQRQDLVLHVYKVAEELNVTYDSGPAPRLLYFAGPPPSATNESGGAKAPESGGMAPGSMFPGMAEAK